MLALRQHFHLLAVVEYSEADAALAVGEILLVVGNRDLVQNDGEAVDGGSIESLPPPQRRVGWPGSDSRRRRRAEAADPPGVEEEKRHHKDDGEKDDDEEESAAADLEVAVVELRVVPMEWLRGFLMGRHVVINLLVAS